MSSKIQQGLGRVTSSARGRLNGVKGRRYQAASVSADLSAANQTSKLSQSIGNFMDAATKAGHYYIDRREETAKQNLKKILDKLPPEMIREERAAGRILAHDDPYTVAALNRHLAGMESDAVYTRVSERLNAGKYASRAELADDLTSQLKEQKSAMRAAYGVSDDDEDWENGWNSDVEAKNIALYQQYDGIADRKAKNLARLASAQSVSQLANDSTLTPQEFGEAALFQINQMSDQGVIRDGEQKRETLKSLTNAILSKPNAVERLNAIESRTVELDGQQVTLKEAMGDAEWSLMVSKANQASFTQSMERQRAYMASISFISTDNNGNIDQRQLELNKLKADINTLQDNDLVSEQKVAVERLQAQLDAEKLKMAAEIDQKMKDTMGVEVDLQKLDAQYSAVLKGEIGVSTNTSTMTGFDGSTMKADRDVIYAERKFSDIDAREDMTEDQKIEAKLKYVAASPKDSAFRKILGESADASLAAWQAAIMQTDPEKIDLSKVEGFYAVYQKDPALVTALYPEAVHPMIQMEMMSKYGLDKEVLLNSERQRQGRTREESNRLFEEQWKQVTNDSRYASLVGLSGKALEVGRKVYEAYSLSGNTDFATKETQKWFDKNAVMFTDGSGSGTIPKSFLQVDGDPKSIEPITAGIKAMIESAGAANDRGLMVEMHGDNVLLRDSTGNGLNTVLTRDDLRKMYQGTLPQAKPKVSSKEVLTKEAGKKSMESRKSYYQFKDEQDKLNENFMKR